MRVFYALTPPPLIQQHCLYLINLLKTQPQFANLRWARPDDLHITLRFHSQIEASQVDSINHELQQKLPTYEGIPLATRRLILLPSRKPHSLALAIHLNNELAELVRFINQTHTNVGINLEKRPFLAHITLGRFNATTHDASFVLDPVKSVEDTAKEVVLYQSEPTEVGSRYTPLNSFHLQ